STGTKYPNTSQEELKTSNEELKLLNLELREARRAAYNLLEDAHQTRELLELDFANMRLLRELSEKLVSEENIQEHFRQVLDVAILITKADAGTLQIFNEETKQLELLATKGFNKKMTLHFAFVDAASHTSCGVAFANKERTFIDFDLHLDEDPD